jgi:hypothetical protein
MPHLVEIAPSGRARCRGCKQPIAKDAPRFAEEAPNPYSEEGGMAHRYWHLACAAPKLANELGAALAAFDGPIEDRASIEALIAEHIRPEMPYVEHASSGRAKCRVCDETIKKGELRVAFERVFDGPMGPQKGAAYAHPGCVGAYLDREKERGREAPDRQEAVRLVTAHSKLPADELEAVARAMTGEAADAGRST